MSFGEYFRVLHSQTNERIYVEKPTVAEVPFGSAPICKAVILTLQKGVKRRVVKIQLRDHLVDSVTQSTVRRQHLVQPVADYPPIHDHRTEAGFGAGPVGADGELRVHHRRPD